MSRGVKAFAQLILPSAVVLAARNLWEDLRDWVGVFGFWLHFVAMRAPFPKVLLYFGFAPGDDLLCTAVLRELRKRGKDRILMVSNHADLFIGNDDPSYILPLWKRYSPDKASVAICQRFAKMTGAHFR